MANRYWVGGTATWDATAGTKWATTSGGSGGASVPTASDNVFFDAASGVSTVTISSSSCGDLTCTGFTGTMTGTSVAINVSGNIVFSASMTLSGTVGINWQPSVVSTYSITSAGQVFGNNLVISSSGSVFNLNDAFFCTATLFGIRAVAGTFNTNGYTVTLKRFLNAGTAAGTINLGSSTININETTSGSAITVVDFSGSSVVVNAGTSIFNISGPTSSSRELRINAAGKTFYNIDFLDCAGTATHTFSSACTINRLRSLHSTAFTTKITDGTTLTVTDWQCNGVVGALNTLTNTTSTTAGNLVKAGGGSAIIDYAAISWVNATPSSTWFATNSTDAGNNSGITFGYPPNANNLFFGSNF